MADEEHSRTNKNIPNVFCIFNRELGKIFKLEIVKIELIDRKSIVDHILELGKTNLFVFYVALISTLLTQTVGYTTFENCCFVRKNLTLFTFC